MIKCPKCGGYGKAVSTRNLEDCVVRYHKCTNCRYSFTSTQRSNESSYLSSNTIGDELNSDSFNFCISLLKNSFLLSTLNFYNDSSEIQQQSNEYVIHSNQFKDSKHQYDCFFEINLKTYDNRAVGSIHLINKTKNKIMALVGYIYRDDDWKINLSTEIINNCL